MKQKLNLKAFKVICKLLNCKKINSHKLFVKNIHENANSLPIINVNIDNELNEVKIQVPECAGRLMFSFHFSNNVVSVEHDKTYYLKKSGGAHKFIDCILNLQSAYNNSFTVTDNYNNVKLYTFKVFST